MLAHEAQVMYRKANTQHLFTFLEKTYEETLTLLTYSRDYFYRRSKLDKAILSSEEHIIYTMAMSTITTRLTSALGWLITCKAVQEGEITLEESFSDEFRMQKFEMSVDSNDPLYEALNHPMKEMLEKSERLYRRVERMEDSVHKCLLKAG